MTTTNSRITIIELSLAEYDQLVDKLGTSVHDSLICFTALVRDGSRFRKKLHSVKTRIEAREQGIVDTIAELGVKEYFVFKHGKRGVEAFYYTIDGTYTHERTLIKLQL